MAEAPPTIRFRFWLWLIALVVVIVPRRLHANWRQEWEAESRYREAMLKGLMLAVLAPTLMRDRTETIMALR